MNECNYPTKVAWRYLGISVRSLLNYLIVPRMEVAGLNDISSKANKARIIWAMLQVHVRMNSLIECGFKSHPVLTTTMTTFVMKHQIDSSQLEAVVTKCDLISKSGAAIDKRVSVLETNSKTVATDIKFMKTKIK